jgi:hypothetical protein
MVRRAVLPVARHALYTHAPRCGGRLASIAALSPTAGSRSKGFKSESGLRSVYRQAWQFVPMPSDTVNSSTSGTIIALRLSFSLAFFGTLIFANRHSLVLISED